MAGETEGGGGGNILELSLSPGEFFCKPKTFLKTKA